MKWLDALLGDISKDAKLIICAFALIGFAEFLVIVAVRFAILPDHPFAVAEFGGGMAAVIVAVSAALKLHAEPDDKPEEEKS